MIAAFLFGAVCGGIVVGWLDRRLLLPDAREDNDDPYAGEFDGIDDRHADSDWPAPVVGHPAGRKGPGIGPGVRL